MNNRFLKTTVAAIGLVFAALTANATPITITDTFDPEGHIRLASYGTRYDFTHDINELDFNPAIDTVLSATLSLDVYDDGDYDYTRYGSSRYLRYCSWRRCYYGTRYYVISYGQTEWLNVSADGRSLGTWEIDYSDIFLSDLAEDLQDDGLLNVSLWVTSGDLYFNRSTLAVEIERGISVPEPGTLALLGIGLLGAGLRRRIRAH